MLIDDLKITYQKNKAYPAVYVRNSLKEIMQYYLLHYISQLPLSENLIFKGDTCLRIFFDLPRLSEDLDFDWSGSSQFDMDSLALSIKKYFTSTFRFDALETKIAGNYHTLYVKFPVLDQVGLPLTPSDSKILFVRLDITPTQGSTFTTEPAIKSTRDFSFVLKRYSLPDLMVGKIAAILTRETIEGRVKQATVKGRDYFDLIWFLEKGVAPNWSYLTELTGLTKTKAINAIKAKILKVNERSLRTELAPYFPDPTFVRTFSRNLLNFFNQYLPVLRRSYGT